MKTICKQERILTQLVDIFAWQSLEIWSLTLWMKWDSDSGGPYSKRTHLEKMAQEGVKNYTQPISG